MQKLQELCASLQKRADAAHFSTDDLFNIHCFCMIPSKVWSSGSKKGLSAPSDPDVFQILRKLIQSLISQASCSCLAPRHYTNRKSKHLWHGASWGPSKCSASSRRRCNCPRERTNDFRVKTLTENPNRNPQIIWCHANLTAQCTVSASVTPIRNSNQDLESRSPTDFTPTTPLWISSIEIAIFLVYNIRVTLTTVDCGFLALEFNLEALPEEATSSTKSVKSPQSGRIFLRLLFVRGFFPVCEQSLCEASLKQIELRLAGWRTFSRSGGSDPVYDTSCPCGWFMCQIIIQGADPGFGQGVGQIQKAFDRFRFLMGVQIFDSFGTKCELKLKRWSLDPFLSLQRSTTHLTFKF